MLEALHPTVIGAAALPRGCGCKHGQSGLAERQVGKAFMSCPRSLNVWAVNCAGSKKRYDCRKEEEE